MTVTESIRASTNLCYFSIRCAIMMCYFMILRSVTNLRCVTCYKLDPDGAFIVYYLLLCAYAVMHRWWPVRSILSADRRVHATCFILRVYLDCALIFQCLDLRVTFFCWTLYGTFWPRVCSVLIPLLVLCRFWQFEFPFELLFLHLLLLYFSCPLSFCCV